MRRDSKSNLRSKENIAYKPALQMNQGNRWILYFITALALPFVHPPQWPVESMPSVGGHMHLKPKL